MAIANDDEYDLQHVLKDDSGNTYEECDVSEPFFVLLDYVNDPHALAAIAAYAESCKAENPELASELLQYAAAPS